MSIPASFKSVVRTLAAIAPFVAAAIAALGTRHDYRILWMAIVATIVAWLTFRSTRRRIRPAWPLALLTSASCASATAVLCGARDVIGVGAVAVVVAAFATVGATVD